MVLHRNIGGLLFSQIGVHVREQIKRITFKHRADLFGIAPVGSFDGASKGFHPRSIYSRAKTYTYGKIGLFQVKGSVKIGMRSVAARNYLTEGVNPSVL